MKTRLILITVAGALLGTLALAPPAEAGHLDWSFGVGFHVGALQFRVGFAPYGHLGYPGPFFLTTSRLHVPGHACHGACFRSGAAYYHHAACPVLGLHLRRGGYGPDYYLRSYAPYRGYGRGYVAPPYRGYVAPPYRGYVAPPYRGYRNYSRHGTRDRVRPYSGQRYGDRRQRDHRDENRYRNDRRRRGYDRDDDSDRRHYQDDRRRGGRDRSRSGRGAGRTRPPG